MYICYVDEVSAGYANEWVQIEFSPKDCRNVGSVEVSRRDRVESNARWGLHWRWGCAEDDVAAVRAQRDERGENQGTEPVPGSAASFRARFNFADWIMNAVRPRALSRLTLELSYSGSGERCPAYCQLALVHSVWVCCRPRAVVYELRLNYMNVVRKVRYIADVWRFGSRKR